MNETGAGKIDTGRLMRQATYASVGVALILIGAKLFAYLMTDSVSLLSTLLDSLLDAAASLVNLVAVRTALTPADAEHRFGHGKAEPLAALGQSAFIAGSALFLLVEAGNRVVNPSPIQIADVRSPVWTSTRTGCAVELVTGERLSTESPEIAPVPQCGIDRIAPCPSAAISW